MTEKNNQDLTKVYELIQKENQWNRITNLAQTFLVLIPTLILIWKSFKRRKLSPKQRLMRIETAMARLQLEREAVCQEALHEAELKKMETGLDGEGKFDFLSGLKKTSELIQNQEKVFQKNVDKIRGVKDKFLDPEKEKKE